MSHDWKPPKLPKRPSKPRAERRSPDPDATDTPSGAPRWLDKQIGTWGLSEPDRLRAATRVERVHQIHFANLFAYTANVVTAAREARVPAAAARRWLDDAHAEKPTDPELAELLLEAEKQACDVVEQEIRRRAVEGVPEPIIANGEVIFAYFHRSTNELLRGGWVERGRGKKRTRELEVIDGEGNPLAPAEYVARPVSRTVYSDKLLLALARRLMPSRYGAVGLASFEKPPARVGDASELVIDVREEGAAVAARERGNGSVH